MSRIACLPLTALVLVGCSARLPGPTAEQTWVRISGQIPQELSLEVGDMAWQIEPDGGGIVAAPISEPAMVRLFRVADCYVYAMFEITPGSAYAIGLSGGDSVTLENITGGPIEMGPGLVERAGGPTGCE